MDAIKQMVIAFHAGNLKDDKGDDKIKRHMSHQKNVVLRMIVSFTIMPLYLWLGYHYIPINPQLPTLTDRIAYTIKWQWPSVVLLAVIVHTTSVARFTTEALNPIEGKEVDSVQVNKNVLTNTLEQYVLNLMAQLMLAVYLTEGQMKVIPLFVVLFVIGRIQYWIGYMDPSYGRSNKSFGWFMSAYGTLMILIYCGYRFFMD